MEAASLYIITAPIPRSISSLSRSESAYTHGHYQGLRGLTVQTPRDHKTPLSASERNNLDFSLSLQRVFMPLFGFYIINMGVDLFGIYVPAETTQTLCAGCVRYETKYMRAQIIIIHS